MAGAPHAAGPPDTVRLFVYGTLMSGQPGHAQMAGARLLGPARTLPQYRLLDLHDYPGLVEPGTQAVAGELYDVPQPLLARLDAFEECPRLFRRAPVGLHGAAPAQAYLLQPAFAPDRPGIAGGDWRRRDG